MLGTVQTVLLAAVTVLLAVFWRKVRRYPAGPLPFPILGNLWSMRRWPQSFYKMGPELARKYGDPFTLWFGWFPIVVVNDLRALKEASVGPKRNHTAGRLQFTVGTLQKRGNEDIVFGKFGPEWEALRKVSCRERSDLSSNTISKSIPIDVSEYFDPIFVNSFDFILQVAHLAVRKYAVSEGLENLVVEVIDDIIDHSSPDKPFDLDVEILEALHNIIGMCVFGQQYERDSEDLRTIRRINGELRDLLPKVRELASCIGEVAPIDDESPLRRAGRSCYQVRRSAAYAPVGTISNGTLGFSRYSSSISCHHCDSYFCGTKTGRRTCSTSSSRSRCGFTTRLDEPLNPARWVLKYFLMMNLFSRLAFAFLVEITDKFSGCEGFYRIFANHSISG